MGLEVISGLGAAGVGSWTGTISPQIQAGQFPSLYERDDWRDIKYKYSVTPNVLSGRAFYRINQRVERGEGEAEPLDELRLEIADWLKL